MLCFPIWNCIECSDSVMNTPWHSQHNICFEHLFLSVLCQQSNLLISQCRHAQDCLCLCFHHLACVASNLCWCLDGHCWGWDTTSLCCQLGARLGKGSVNDLSRWEPLRMRENFALPLSAILAEWESEKNGLKNGVRQKKLFWVWGWKRKKWQEI